jgi:hypothetical protein
LLALACVASCVATNASDPVRCGASNPTFPPFDRSCATVTDCFIAIHVVDCCGSTVAMGLSTAERTGFAADEARCAAMYPGCRCAPAPVQADDGNTAESTRQVSLHCDQGRCATTAP